TIFLPTNTYADCGAAPLSHPPPVPNFSSCAEGARRGRSNCIVVPTPPDILFSLFSIFAANPSSPPTSLLTVTPSATSMPHALRLSAVLVERRPPVRATRRGRLACRSIRASQRRGDAAG